jgi:LTXXQ motif family protein
MTVLVIATGGAKHIDWSRRQRDLDLRAAASAPAQDWIQVVSFKLQKGRTDMIMQLTGKTLGTLTAAVLGTATLVASLPAAAADRSPLREHPAQVILAQASQAAASLAAAGGEAREGHVEAKIKSLHDQLHITADQQQQWEAVAAVMRSNAETVNALIRKRVQNASMMSAIDDLRSYQQIAEAHAEGLSKLVPAFEALYGTMSNDQKKSADIAFGHLHRHAEISHQPTR